VATGSGIEATGVMIATVSQNKHLAGASLVAEHLEAINQRTARGSSPGLNSLISNDISTSFLSQFRV
jgi:hypothetical protein